MFTEHLLCTSFTEAFTYDINHNPESQPTIPIFKTRDRFSQRSRNESQATWTAGSGARTWTHICLMPSSILFPTKGEQSRSHESLQDP